MNIGPDIQTIQQRKDPHNQAIANALQKLGQTTTALENFLASVTSGVSPSGLPTSSQFRFVPITYAATYTPIFPADTLYYTNRISLTGNITINPPYGMKTGQIYTIILETDASPRTASFAIWYSFLPTATIVIPANSRYVVTCVATDTPATLGRQLSIHLIPATSGGGTTWTGPTLIAPTAAGTWTPINGITVGSGSQNTITLSKATAGAGFALKALPAGVYDIIAGVTSITFGNVTSGISALPTFGLFVTNGTTPGTHQADGVAAFAYNVSGADAGILTRRYNPLNSLAPTAITAYYQVGDGLGVGKIQWFRITGNASSYSLYTGDGFGWELIHSQALTCTHFGFGLDPTGGIATTPSTQIVRIVSCNT
jgi:hypothetical protein